MSHLPAILEATKNHVIDYVQRFPSEVFSLGRLLLDLDKNSVSIFDRWNSAGHVTVSVLVVNNSGTHVLLLDRGPYGGRLACGNVDATAPQLEQSAARCMLDDTGLLLSVDSMSLLDINTHAGILFRCSHRHDFLFLATAPDEFIPSKVHNEICPSNWCPISYLTGNPDPRMQRLGAKLIDIQNSL